jgi:hypothetical protein
MNPSIEYSISSKDRELTQQIQSEQVKKTVSIANDECNVPKVGSSQLTSGNTSPNSRDFGLGVFVIRDNFQLVPSVLQHGLHIGWAKLDVILNLQRHCLGRIGTSTFRILVNRKTNRPAFGKVRGSRITKRVQERPGFLERLVVIVVIGCSSCDGWQYQC